MNSNAVHPGLISTEVGRDVFKNDEQVDAEAANSVPICAGRSEESAAAVWLCSPGASYGRLSSDHRRGNDRRTQVL